MGGANPVEWILVALVVLVLAGGSALSRWVEGWGMPSSRAAGARGPYGRLDGVRVVAGKPAPRRLALLARCLLVSETVAGALVAAEAIMASAPVSTPAVTDIAFVGMFAAMAAALSSVGLRQSILYGFAGYLLFGAVMLLPVAALDYAFDLSGPALFALVNLLPVAGTAFGIALSPRRLRFERTFEDGRVDRIWVSARSRSFEPLRERAERAAGA